MSDGLLRNWRKQFELEGALGPTPGGGIEEENRRLKLEREIKKKATAFFASPNG